MPDGTPLDINFTSFVDAPAEPSHPGASDFSQLQNAAKFMANPPSARISRGDTQTIPSSLSFVGMYWNIKAWASDPTMTGNIGPGYVDRIILPYPGEYEATVIVRSQFNNVNTGVAQIQLMRVLADDSEVLIDQDIKPGPTNIANPVVNRITASFLISAAHVAATAGIRVEYAQNTGGNASVMASTGVSAYPSLSVRWVGTGNL